MFFTTLLLEEMLSWTRRQSGTTSLKALLYFDEVFGYLPPHPANPPSKQPLLTLLKQARAFGVGVLLATQNPVDLDYKALSNAGTWFVGKLQTERDKARLLDGLESVAAEYGTLTDRGYLEKVIASLGNRIFLMHNINQGKPKLFQSRWALSFLRGPMTREEVARCVKPIKEQDAAGGVAADEAVQSLRRRGARRGRQPLPGVRQEPLGPPVGGAARRSPGWRRRWLPGRPPRRLPAAAPAGEGVRYTQPVLPPDVNQFYIPVAAGSGKPGQELEYQPWVLGFAEVVFQIDRADGHASTRCRLRLLAQAPEPGHPVDWDKAMAIGIEPAPRPEAQRALGGGAGVDGHGKEAQGAGEGVRRAPLQHAEDFAVREPRTGTGEHSGRGAGGASARRCRQKAAAAEQTGAGTGGGQVQPKIEAAEQSTAKNRDDRIAKLEADLQAKLDEIDREISADRRGSDGDPGQAAQGGYPRHALRAGVGPVLAVQ